MLLGNVAASPDTVLAFAVTVYVCIGALLFLRAGPARVRGAGPCQSSSCRKPPTLHELRRYAEWQTLVHMLTRADRMLATGAISPAEYEATWREAYDRLEEITHV